ncbi:MAG: MSHA biogenesis protein MshE, partial [Gammaproteobacteria bacterium]
LTFPIVLRTALRQDPDIILIGEMRDQETVEIGLRAAMTGHLVFSTLHTNDAVSTVSRLLDMGAEGFLVASSLQAVLAQRLVRRLCPDCRKPHELNDQDKLLLERIMGPQPTWPSFYQHTGCNQCNNTGYSGRIGIYELLIMSPDLASCLQQDDNALFVKRAGQKKDFRSLTKNAIELAKQGITTLDEVLRIAGDIDVTPHKQTKSHHDIAI